MNTKRLYQFLVLTLVAVLTLGIASPALAFDPRAGDSIIISAGEVIEDDLYLSANYITIDGTVKGDVYAVGNSITINGVIDGDLVAAARDITINGQVTDDVRFAAYALKLGPQAQIGDDVIAAGYSLEVSQGAAIDGALVLAAYQGLINGRVAGNALFALGVLEFNGVVEGNAQISIGDAKDYRPQQYYMGSDMPVVPSVKPGLNFGPDAQINGKLEYISPVQYSIPAGVVAGAVSYSEPPISPEDVSKYRSLRETNPILNAILQALRFLAALVLIGLLLAWLAPSWISRPAETVQTDLLPSLGVGVLTFFALFFFAGLLITMAIVVAILFGALTLGNLSALTLVLSGSTLAAVILFFSLVANYLSYLVVGYLGGRWILGKINPELSEKIYWPLLLGVVILALLTAIPFLGGLVSFLVVSVGVGAVVILVWRRFRPGQPAAPLAMQPVATIE
jgi:cytoskeletal protein CcmA (bactofilin family)